MIKSIKTINDLFSAYQYCNSYEAQLQFISEIGAQLPDIIHDMNSLIYLIEMIDKKNNLLDTVEKKKSILASDLKPDMIEPRVAAAYVTELVIVRLNDKLKDLTVDFEDLYLLFSVDAKHKHERTSRRIIENLGGQFHDCINNVSQVVTLNSILSPKVMPMVFSRIADKLPGMVNNLEDLKQILPLLCASAQLELIKKMGDKLINMVKNAQDLAGILALAKKDENVSGDTAIDSQSEVKSHLIDMVKNNLNNSHIIASEIDLYMILKRLPAKDQVSVMHSLGENLRNLIKPETNDAIIREFKKTFIKGEYVPPYIGWYKEYHDPVKRDFHADLNRVLNFCGKNATLKLCMLDRFNKAYRHELASDRKLYPYHWMSRPEQKGEFTKRAKQMALSRKIEDVINHKDTFANVENQYKKVEDVFLSEIISNLGKVIPIFTANDNEHKNQGEITGHASIRQNQ